MDQYSLSLVDDIKGFVNQFSDVKNGIDINPYINYYQGLNVTHSLGVGVLSYIPFISFLGHKQQTQKGIYPVLLFYRNHNYAILAMGISETNVPELNWGTDTIQTIGDFFKTNNIALNQRERKYNDSLVFRSYKISSLLFEQVVRDIDSLISAYKELLV